MKSILVIIFIFWSSLSQALLIDREVNHLYISGTVFKQSYEFFAVELANANMELALAGDLDSPIYLHLDLPEGGKGHYALEIVDLIKQMRTYNIKVITIVEPDKVCFSACTFMFLAGDERWMAPSANLMFHGTNYDPAVVSQATIDYHTERYTALYKEVHPNLLKLLEMGEVMKKNITVAFSGEDLYSSPPLKGLITKLLPEEKPDQ